MLEVQEIRKRFGKKVVLEGLSLQLKHGEIFGLLGANGAGKSTILKIITGLVYPDSGKVSIDGDTLSSNDNFNLHKIGAQIDSPAFPGQLSGRQNLHCLARLQGLGTEEADRLLEAVSLESEAHRKTGTYSTGMRQRLAIAAAMLGEPPLLVLDEPTSGLDPQGREAILDLIDNLAKANDLTVLFTSHIFDEVARLCNRVGFLHKGVLVYAGNVENSESLRELYFQHTGTRELVS